jgi:L-aspartate oxidase
MVGQHPLAELAPRDVVAKAITRSMLADGVDHVYLDGREFGAAVWRQRFPTILASCRAHGIDPVTELIPVAPAAHYVSGGVRADIDGRTSVPGLYACGEVACTGVQGANRLASNSLLEGLVFAGRIGADLARSLPPRTAVAATGPYAPHNRPATLLRPTIRDELRRTMTAGAGVLRSHQGLTATAADLLAMRSRTTVEAGVLAWEATNMHAVASTLTAAALARTETRGCHWREDFPGLDDAAWLGHLIGRLDAGEVHLAFEKKE